MGTSRSFFASLSPAIIKNAYKRKQWRPPSKTNKRKKSLSPRNMKACHSVCPLEKRRGDRNPECHEEEQKDVA
jgi:hypothetical protein